MTDKVFFLKGSPLNAFDLGRVGYQRAKHIVVLQGRLQLSGVFVDADALFAVRFIESMMVGMGSNRPTIMSQSTSLQAHRFLPSLRTSNADIEISAPEMVLDSSRFMAGRHCVTNLITSLVGAALYNPSMLRLTSDIMSASYLVINVPKKWHGSRFYNLFDHLLNEKNVMPIGIYRNSVIKKVELEEDKDEDEEKEQVSIWTSLGECFSSMMLDLPKPFAAEEGEEDDRDVRPQLEAPERYIFVTPPTLETFVELGDQVLCFRAEEKVFDDKR